MPRAKVVEQYFMEHRAKLIDIAAFLDRVDRADAQGKDDDFRMIAFRKTLQILNDDEPNRAARVLDLFSDHTTDVPQSAHGMKGASGAAGTSGGGGAA
jgi:hypothetical protein